MRKRYTCFGTKDEPFRPSTDHLDVWPGDTITVLSPLKAHKLYSKGYHMTGLGKLVENRTSGRQEGA